MLKYLQTWWTHWISHFDIPGSFEEASNQVHTALGNSDRESYSVIDFLYDKAQLTQMPQTLGPGIYHHPRPDSRGKTKGTSKARPRSFSLS